MTYVIEKYDMNTRITYVEYASNHISDCLEYLRTVYGIMTLDFKYDRKLYPTATLATKVLTADLVDGSVVWLLVFT